MKIYNHDYSLSTLNTSEMEKSKIRWDSIAKPLHSLGKMEDLIIQIAGITGNSNVSLQKKALVVMCADNGIVEEGVTQTDQSVTAIVAENFLAEKATAAILCRKSGADIFPIDIGMATDTKVERRKIAYGTKNFAKEPAMTREEAEHALFIGIDMVRELKEKGYLIIATGEMGIGNTTTSSALAAYFLKQRPEVMTGRGAGLSSAGFSRKVQVIEDAISHYSADINDPIDALACMGGFDIAGMAGMFLGGAIYQIPIIMDGFISCTAALTAAMIEPSVKDFILASHVSKEPAAHMILKALEKEASLHCDMCLGEGSGAITLYPILDMALEIYNRMSTFSDIEIDAYVPLA